MGIAGAWGGMPADTFESNKDKVERTARAIGEKFGVIIRPMDEKLRNSFGLRLMEGVFVCEVLPGSEAEAYRIKKGHIILRINKQQVHNLADFGRLLGQALQKGAITFSLRYPPQSRYRPERLPQLIPPASLCPLDSYPPSMI